MELSNCNNIIDSLMNGMEKVLESKTVVGEPTHIGDTIIIPLMDVSFGVGVGASQAKNDKSKSGGFGGMSGKMSPNCVLVIKDGQSKLINIKNQDTISKVFDAVPEVLDKITGLVKKKDMPSDEDAVEAAFPEDEE